MAAKKNAPKTFSGSGRKKTAEPLVLSLEDANDEVVEISAYPTVSGWATLEFARNMASDEGGDSMKAVQDYITASFDEENRKKFLKVVENPDNGYEVSDIVEILSSLLEQRAGDRDFTESSQ